jgi:hypothetical protein
MREYHHCQASAQISIALTIASASYLETVIESRIRNGIFFPSRVITLDLNAEPIL